MAHEIKEELPLVLLNAPFHPDIQAALEADPRFRLLVRLRFEGVSPAEAAAAAGLLSHHAGSNRVDVNAALLARFPALRVVSNHGVGVDHIDLPACAARGLPVGNTPGAVTAATADMAWALLLACARRVVAGDAMARAPHTTAFDPFFFGKHVTGATLGVVGCGRIGQAIARRARGFDMPVLYHNRTRLAPEVEAELGCGGAGAGAGPARFCATLAELLGAADFIVVSAPLTPATQGMFNGAAFAACKAGAVFINLGRGELVDQEALCRALQPGEAGGRLAFAGLDVTTPEPLPRDHPLLRAANCIITPHTGSATMAARVLMARLAVENLVAGLRGKQLPAQVQ